MPEQIRRLEASIVWWLLIRMAHRWTSRHMDQFESVKFPTTYGTVYMSLSYETQYPNGFEPVDINGKSQPRASSG